MKLEDGQTYTNADCSVVVTIVGTTKEYPEWVWSIQGFWYDRATGAHVGYSRERGHYLFPIDSWRTLTNVQS